VKPTYRIRNWSLHFENNRTREIKEMAWVPVPNRMDGDGYTELVDHPEGAAHLGAWLAILQIASKCEERGVLRRDGGQPHDARSLSRISRLPPSVFETALARLVEIGWLESLDPAVEGESETAPPAPALIPQEGATIPQEPAADVEPAPQEGAPSRARAEQNRKERTEQNSLSPPTPSHTALALVPVPEERERGSPPAAVTDEDRLAYATATGKGDGWLGSCRDGRYDLAVVRWRDGPTRASPAGRDAAPGDTAACDASCACSGRGWLFLDNDTRRCPEWTARNAERRAG